MQIGMTWPQHQRRECSFRGRAIRLSPKERDILSVLLLRRGCIVSPEEIISALYDADDEPGDPDKMVQVLLHRLRKKLPGAIKTEWGRGYSIDPAATFEPLKRTETPISDRLAKALALA